jgi:TolB-like protein
VSLTSKQLTRLGVLLDEVLPLSLPERRTWIDSLGNDDLPLVRTLRERLLAADPEAVAAGRLEFPHLDDEAPRTNIQKQGDRLGAYELLRPLGSGGMADVWLARRADGVFEREVALKIPCFTSVTTETAERFASECRILASIEAPGIARLYDAGVTPDGVPYIAMEYVRGQHITEWCATHALDTPARIDLFLQVLDAVSCAHALRILHRDIKPSNILVSDRGEVRLLDFGVARLLQPDSDSSLLTREHGRALTPAYASPELLRGEALDVRSDLYSLGIVLHELLTGARPARANDLALSGRLGDVVRKALSPTAADRYANASQFAAALRPFASGGSAGNRTRRLVVAGMSVVVLLAGAALLYRQQYANSAPNATQLPAAQNSIAVLPFVNMSDDPGQDYLSDGLSEEIINQLAHIKGLQVTARTSAFAFKGKNQDLRSIAQQLGVTKLLEGSVRKNGNQLRITAQLINAADGYHLWSETYERPANDVFAIQDEIASKVAARLGPALGMAPSTSEFGGTSSFEAYDHLLRGDVEFAKGTLDGKLAAADQYRQALAIDPGYARASAELVITLGASLVWLTQKAPEIDPERMEAVRHAMRVAPDAPLSLVAKMWVHSDHHEWLEADAATMRAFEAGTDPRAEWIGGGFLTVTGRVRAGLPYREAARRADPLAISVASTVAQQYALLGMGDELAIEYKRIESLLGSTMAADEPMLAYLMGKGATAEQIAERFDNSCPYAPQVCADYARIVRSPDQARSLLRAQLEIVRRSAAPNATSLALLAAYVGDQDIALDALEVLSRSPATPVFKDLWYPVLGEARHTPRFKRIMYDIGFVDLWRQTGRWADACHPVGTDDFECR